jgi:hypothetical protein
MSIVMSMTFAHAQISNADNGLTATGTFPDRIVSLGGTLSNSQTVIDFNSSFSSSSFLMKKGTASYFSVANDGTVKAYKGVILGEPTDAPYEHIINYFANDQYIGRGLKLVNTSSGSIVRLHTINNGLYITNEGGIPTGLVLGSRFNPGDGSEFRAGYQRWEIRAGSFSVNRDWTGNGQFEMTIGDAARKGIIVKSAVSQTANLMEWRNSADAVLSVMNSSGGMGIGTSTPNSNAKLDVNGNIFSSGIIAIGTTDLVKIGSYSLAVNGDAIFKKVKVQLYSSWPDYVFHKNYPLRPLNEVEKFIRENNHLPEVPSAGEVEKEGLDIGDNQALLLKKIEELTLYVIEQNKKIEKQGKKIEELQEQMKKK